MRMRSIAAALPILIATAVFAHMPETITIKAAAKKQPPVVFAHVKHAKLAKSCDTCHHTQKGLTDPDKQEVVKCQTCHLNPKNPKVPGMREMSLTKNPFHIRCISCHKTQKKGPTACAQCHKKA